MKGLIVDAGLKGLSGHNLAYTNAVRSALESEGCPVEVLANKNLPSGLAGAEPYRRTFSLGAFDFPPGRGAMRNLTYLYAQSLIHAHELEAALETIDEPAFVFCHTVADFELISWSRVLARRRMRSRLMILLRHTDGFRQRGRLQKWLHPYWRIRPHYLNAIYARTAGRFVLMTDSDLLTEDYRSIFPHRIVTLPIPVRQAPASMERAPGGPTIQVRVGYLGDARPSKGFDLLGPAILKALSSGPPTSAFVVQCSLGAGATGPASVAQLIRLNEQFGERLILLSQQLSEGEYARLLGSLDVVLLPYLDQKYGESTSGIFAEALALGTPVVVSDGTWMARELRRSGGGLEFRRGDSDDLADKIGSLLLDLGTYRARARAFAAEWRSYHNPQGLARLLLREACL